jgi:hypothetical protein
MSGAPIREFRDLHRAAAGGEILRSASPSRPGTDMWDLRLGLAIMEGMERPESDLAHRRTDEVAAA